MSFSIPESIRAYLENSDIRAATLALLEAKQHVPEDIDWSELPKYYRAMAAAQRVKADHAIAMYDLWQSVWVGSVEGWTSVAPAVQAHTDWGSAVTVDFCWGEGGLIRCFKKSEADRIWLSVQFDETGCSIGYADDRDPEVLLRQLPGWTEWADPWIKWESSANVETAEFDVAQLRAAANELMETLHSKKSTGRSRS